MFAIDEVVRGGHVEIGDVDAGGGVPDTDEFSGLRIGQGFEEDRFENAEYHGVAADARGEGDGREERSAREPAENLFEVDKEHLHGRGLQDLWLAGQNTAGWPPQVITQKGGTMFPESLKKQRR